MKRIDWVDTLKGIGIILMVLGHYPAFTYTGRMLALIYSFHMPLFLFIGGFLFGDITDGKGLVKKIRSGVRTLVVPYIGFSLISLIFSWPANEQVASSYLYGISYGLGTENMPNVPLWFFTFYFTGRCIFSVMVYLANAAGKKNRAVKEAVLFILTVLLIAAASRFRLKLHKPRLPWNAEMSAICIGFFYLGYQYKRWNPKKEIKSGFLWIICGLSFVLWIPAAFFGTRVDINASYFGRGVIYFYMTATLALIWCVGLSVLLTKQSVVKQVLGFLGRNSMYVVGFHIPMNYFVGVVLLPMMPAAVQAVYQTKTVSGVLFTVIATIILSLMAGGIWKEAKNSLRMV